MILSNETPLSTEDIFASNFKVYPNPAKDYISIQSNNIKINSVEVYNVIGKRLLLSTKLNDNKLNISNLNAGVYLLKISANERTLVKKVIIE